MASTHRCVDEDGAIWLAPIDAGEPMWRTSFLLNRDMAAATLVDGQGAQSQKVQHPAKGGKLH